MNAIEMLKKQHREVAKLFERFQQAKSADGRQQLFEQIADKLAIHAAIEERHFYPSVKNKATDDLLLESVEEHLEMKRIIADSAAARSGGRTLRRQGEGAPGERGAPRRGRGD